MIVSGEKALSFTQRPKAGINTVLAFGQDAGVVSDTIQSLISKWKKLEKGDLEIVRLQEEELKKDPALLAETLTAVSLLGSKQCIRVRLSNESLSKQFINLIEDISKGIIYPENYLAIEAPDLKKKSKLRECFSSSPDAACLHLFADTEDQIADYIKTQLRNHNILIDDLALELFASDLPGDRRLANSEIEKLSLYAHELNRSINEEDIKQIAATEQPRGADDAADAALAGNAGSANQALDRYLDAGGSAISALRTLHFRLLRVIDAQSGARFLRPPVFDKERPAFNKMLKDWNSTRSNRALSMLYAAEKSCKQAGISTEAILKIVIDRISRRLF